LTFPVLGLVLVVLAAGPVGAQKFDDIFAINADGLRAASGFKVQDTQGRTRIVTSLHVVAGARRKSASNAIFRVAAGIRNATVLNPNHKVFHNLEIREVNLDRDLAMLGSDELDGQPGGLAVAWNADLQALARRTVTVIGYPHNLDYKEIPTDILVRGEPLAPLKFLADGAARAEFARRGSPSLEAWMLSLNGPLMPGHSGAPIFDDRGRVVAVACGGLDSGHGGLVWASPLVDEFVPASVVQGRLDALRVSANLFGLFAIAPILPPTPREAAGPLATEIVNLTSSPNPAPVGEKIAFYA